MNDEEADERLPWTTPTVVPLGNMVDARSDVGGDMDIDGLNQDPFMS